MDQSHRPPCRKRLCNRNSISVLEVSAHGKAARDARNRELEWRQLSLNVQRRGLSLNAWVRGEYYFTHISAGDTALELRNGEIFGPNAIEWREPPSKDVINSPKFTGAFDCADIRCVFDGADRCAVTPRIAADRADVILGKIEATRTRPYPLERHERVGETADVFCGLLEQMIRETKCRLAADAWQPRKLGRKGVDRRHLERELERKRHTAGELGHLLFRQLRRLLLRIPERDYQ